MKKVTRILIAVAILFLIILAMALYRQYIINTETIIKRAVSLSDVENGNYIIAKEYGMSGAGWIRVDRIDNQAGNIIVDFPPDNSFFDYEFCIRHNQFIFYIESESIEDFYGEEIIQYIATDWDVIGPVKHKNMIRDIILWDYITEYDLNETGMNQIKDY